MPPPPDLPPRRRLGLAARIVLWSTVGIVGFFLLLAAIGSIANGNQPTRPATPTAKFDRAITDGADCAELFEIRNQINRDTNDTLAARLNDRLRGVGCYSSTSTRNR